MKIIQKKTKYLCAEEGRKQERNINVPRVNAFKYLGSTMRDVIGKDIEVGKK